MSNAKSSSGKQGEESLGAGASVSADAGSSAIEFTSEPCISAIVPARNEEAVIGACVKSLAEQVEFGEILGVHDQSSTRGVGWEKKCGVARRGGRWATVAAIYGCGCRVAAGGDGAGFANREGVECG